MLDDNDSILLYGRTVICADCHIFINDLDEEIRQKFTNEHYHKGHKMVFVADLEEFK